MKKEKKPSPKQLLEAKVAELQTELKFQRERTDTEFSNGWKLKDRVKELERKLNAAELSEQSLTESCHAIQRDYFEQKGRADALELALRFTQKVPEKTKGSACRNLADAAKSDLSDAMRYSFFGHTPRY